ncbi:tRNA (adenosine(37)-N6)-dimethylallyltransferase MiaA [Candidatus Saccharibacteria bacterium oral taxon 488]|nr:tRNA (adenosine(37)-N6)-dimethylallyltransferase MiaA [Candidatus Saccharibacteria bacterium oral taxon 488]
MAAETIKAKLPLVVIAGPTASGKTSLAIRLAKQYNGEIICADSRTIYRDMDIGTAKPTMAEREVVPHWGLDLVSPGETFSAAQFKEYALQKISEIRSRGCLPFLVGGTGLYIDAVIFNFQFGDPPDSALRRELEKRTVAELQYYCYKYNIKLPENNKNKRYLIRAIEQKSKNNRYNFMTRDNSIVVGIATNKEILRTRIVLRSEQLFLNNVVNEAMLLARKYGWDNEAMTGNVYPLVREFLNKNITESELKRQFVVADWQLAKRQMTWLRRNPFIMWATLDSAEHYLSQLLAQA